jgi:hypothetical protein
MPVILLGAIRGMATHGILGMFVGGTLLRWAIRYSWVGWPTGRPQKVPGTGRSPCGELTRMPRRLVAGLADRRLFPIIASLGLRGEIGDQLYKEFGAGKLDGVNFQRAMADEAQHAGHGLWRLDTAWAALEQTQARG